ncbi:MAG: MarR family winged helix-turn-helix transcriptional regulator [Micrococcus sp.]|nr:MarR family winged helix-turn-helix transcriptional regulator [Micrococcus sp.]
MPAPPESSVPPPDLGDLMHVAFRRLRRGWSEQLAPFGLTPYQFRALQAVARGPHGHDSVVGGRDGMARGEEDAHGAAACGEGGRLAPDPAPAVAPTEAGLAQSPAVAAQGPVAASEGAEGLRLKDLAERLRIAPRSATEVVDQLQDRGLVERRPDPADRRATRIVLTEDGARVREQVREERRRQAGDYFSVLSEADRAELARLLTDLVRSHP